MERFIKLTLTNNRGAVYIDALCVGAVADTGSSREVYTTMNRDGKCWEVKETAEEILNMIDKHY